MVRAVSGQATMYLPQSPLTLKWSNTITKSFQWQRSPSTRPDWCGLDIFPEGDTALLWNIWLNSFLNVKCSRGIHIRFDTLVIIWNVQQKKKNLSEYNQNSLCSFVYTHKCYIIALKCDTFTWANSIYISCQISFWIMTAHQPHQQECEPQQI